jgi:hypothetical protein
VDQRGEQLDLTAPDAQLAHAAAVHDQDVVVQRAQRVRILDLEGENRVQALVLARLDDQRQPCEPRPERLAVQRRARGVHRRHCCITPPAGRLGAWLAPRRSSGPGDG